MATPEPNAGWRSGASLPDRQKKLAPSCQFVRDTGANLEIAIGLRPMGDAA